MNEVLQTCDDTLHDMIFCDPHLDNSDVFNGNGHRRWGHLKVVSCKLLQNRNECIMTAIRCQCNATYTDALKMTALLLYDNKVLPHL